MALWGQCRLPSMDAWPAHREGYESSLHLQSGEKRVLQTSPKGCPSGRFFPFLFPPPSLSRPAAGGGSRLAALPSPLPPSLPAGCSLPVGRREASPPARDAMAPPGSALPACLLGLLLLVCRGGKSRAGLGERAGTRTRGHGPAAAVPGTGAAPRGRSVRPSFQHFASPHHPRGGQGIARPLIPRHPRRRSRFPSLVRGHSQPHTQPFPVAPGRRRG